VQLLLTILQFESGMWVFNYTTERHWAALVVTGFWGSGGARW